MAAMNDTEIKNDHNVFPNFLSKDFQNISLEMLFPELSERQRECLFCYCSGLDAAQHLNLTTGYITHVLTAVRERLGVVSSHDLKGLYLTRLQMCLLQFLLK